VRAPSARKRIRLVIEKILSVDALTTGMPELGITERDTYAFRLRVNYQRFCPRTLAVSV